MILVKLFKPAVAAFIPAGLLMVSQPTSAADVESRAEIVIAASPDKVWNLLTEIQDWPKWNPAVESVRFDGSVKTGNSFQWKSGGFSVTSTLQTIDTGKQLTWTGVALGTKAYHSWDIEQTPTGVKVRTYETFDGWLPWLLRGAMKETLDDTLHRWLLTLKNEAEKKSKS